MNNILEEAQRLVNTDRHKDYGDPSEDFSRIATIWSTLLSERLSEDLTPEDVAIMMIALKLSRAVFNYKRDNWIDIAGYAHCTDLCSQHKQQNL